MGQARQTGQTGQTRAVPVRPASERPASERPASERQPVQTAQAVRKV